MARSAQYIDSNGFLLVKGCPVSRPGIFSYSAAQCGETEDDNHGDPNRIVNVYRPEAAVNDPEFIETLKHVPLIDDHEFMIGDTSVLDGDEATSPEEKGVEGVMTDNVYYNAPWLKADIKIFSRRLQQAIKAGKKDLSLGYLSKFDYAPGEYQGQKYDYVQTNMRGNHIALVDEGRVSGARVLDGLVFDSMGFDVPSTSNNHKPESKTMDEELKARLAALLPELQAMCGNPGDKENEPVIEGDESELTHSEHEREAGAEEGVDEVIKRLEAMVSQLKEGAGEVAHEKAKEAGDSDDAEKVGDEDEKKSEDSDDLEETGDEVDGLTKADSSPQLDLDGKPNPLLAKAAKGPAAGAHDGTKTGDAALRAVYADIADREALAKRLSKHIGTFDSSRMTSHEVGVYGVKKLGLKGVTKGSARIALDAYLMGAEQGAKKAAPAVVTGDSANADISSDMRKYLNGQ